MRTLGLFCIVLTFLLYFVYSVPYLKWLFLSVGFCNVSRLHLPRRCRAQSLAVCSKSFFLRRSSPSSSSAHPCLVSMKPSSSSSVAPRDFTLLSYDTCDMSEGLGFRV
jgi:hypothetical protein